MTRPLENAPRAPGQQQEGSDDGWQGISRGRKLRLLALLAVMGALLAAAVLFRARHRRTLAASLEALRDAARAMDFAAADEALERVRGLDPDNEEATRLSVGLCYAGRQLDNAVAGFNALDPDGLAAMIDPADARRSMAVVEPLGFPPGQAASFSMDGPSRAYLAECGFLWNLARSVAGGAETQRERALLLARWSALHLLPDRTEGLPLSPYMALLRGRGSPALIAWTFAEMARQLDVRCEVIVAGGAAPEDRRHLVQVYPEGAEAFLVDAAAGVPVFDPETGEPASLAALLERPSAFGDLLGSGKPADFHVADRGVAVHPFAFLPRFRAFGELLSELPAHPRVAFEFPPGPLADQVRLLPEPIAPLVSPPSPEAYQRVLAIQGATQLIEQPRRLHLGGAHGSADRLYAATAGSLAEMLAEADVQEGVQLLGDALEDVRFFWAVNAFDAGDAGAAATRLAGYLDEYPQGRWRPLARTLEAELLSREGDPESAAELWANLPPARALYGTLRGRALLPIVPAPTLPDPQEAP